MWEEKMGEKGGGARGGDEQEKLGRSTREHGTRFMTRVAYADIHQAILPSGCTHQAILPQKLSECVPGSPLSTSGGASPAYASTNCLFGVQILDSDEALNEAANRSRY